MTHPLHRQIRKAARYNTANLGTKLSPSKLLFFGLGYIQVERIRVKHLLSQYHKNRIFHQATEVQDQKGTKNKGVQVHFKEKFVGGFAKDKVDEALVKY